MGLFSMLGLSAKTASVKDFIEKGAVIIDVRTVDEFIEGNIKDSKNIPLDIIPQNIEKIKKFNKPVIVYCQSGMRSRQANSILIKNGIESINGGGYSNIINYFKP